MARTKQVARRLVPAHDAVETACRDARLATATATTPTKASGALRDYEGWCALFAKASPMWLNDQRIVLPANERAGMRDYSRALREALAMPRP